MQSEKPENENTPPPETPLSWTGGWRNVYAAAAKELGYECRWSNGRLLITKDRDLVGYGVPAKNGYFLMSGFIKAVADDRRVRLEKTRLREEARASLRKESGTATIKTPDAPARRNVLGAAALLTAAAMMGMSRQSRALPQKGDK